MLKKNLLGISVEPLSKKDILEKIKKNIQQPAEFFHVVSLNPENIVIAQQNLEFRKTIETAQIKIVDGIGIVIASKILKIEAGERVTGVGLVKDLVMMASQRRLRVLLIGGRRNLALRLAQCYQQTYPKVKFLGDYGIKDIKNPQQSEEKKIFSIVASYKPHIVLVAFGSPDQELWIDRHKDLFKNCLVMGVGGAFDFLSGQIPRAPKFLRKIGLEWLFRLFIQPWRWKRQLKIIKFIWLVIKQRLSS